jgi:hypothetical protein
VAESWIEIRRVGSDVDPVDGRTGRAFDCRLRGFILSCQLALAIVTAESPKPRAELAAVHG